MTKDGHVFQEIRDVLATARDVARWKLIALGVVSSVAMGLGAPGTHGQPLLFILVPPIALYCDLMILDNRRRAQSLAVLAASERRDEHTVAYARRLVEGWHHRDVATLGSSLTACVFLFVMAYMRMNVIPEGTAQRLLDYAAIGGGIALLAIHGVADLQRRALVRELGTVPIFPPIRSLSGGSAVVRAAEPSSPGALAAGRLGEDLEHLRL